MWLSAGGIAIGGGTILFWVCWGLELVPTQPQIERSLNGGLCLHMWAFPVDSASDNCGPNGDVSWPTLWITHPPFFSQTNKRLWLMAISADRCCIGGLQFGHIYRPKHKHLFPLIWGDKWADINITRLHNARGVNGVEIELTLINVHFCG